MTAHQELRELLVDIQRYDQLRPIADALAARVERALTTLDEGVFIEGRDLVTVLKGLDQWAHSVGNPSRQVPDSLIKILQGAK